MHPLIESHRHPLIELARRRGIGNLRVFGSMARGDADADSDVDLLVTLPPGASALALGGLLMDAQELLGQRVDVVTEPARCTRPCASASSPRASRYEARCRCRHGAGRAHAGVDGLLCTR